jgi:exonuclease SbcC
MGKMVADSWIKNISLKATENFRDITGRAEKIDWINNERESFAVYLVDGEDSMRKFNLLSGGEQVAVALSIRAAMATLMSDANFSIFDEPTNNLDMERKLALADSLDKILKGCRQNIIVTHDDTFREMAQNVIEL